MKFALLLLFLCSISIYAQINELKLGDYAGKYKARDDKGMYGGMLFRDGGSAGFQLQIIKGSYCFSVYDEVKQYGSYSISNQTIEIGIDSIYMTKGHYINSIAYEQYSSIDRSDIYDDFNRDRTHDREYFLYDLSADEWTIKRAWHTFCGTFQIKFKRNFVIIYRNNAIGKWKMKLKPT